MRDARHIVLTILLEAHPGLLSDEELTRETTSGADSFADRDGVAVALRELIAAGLVNRVGGFVFASHAATVLNRLEP